MVKHSTISGDTLILTLVSGTVEAPGFKFPVGHSSLVFVMQNLRLKIQELEPSHLIERS